MAVSFSRIPQASSIFAAYASLSAFIMLVQTMLNQLVPRHVQDYLLDLLRHFFKPRRDYSTVVIEEREGMSLNEVYAAVETYLCTKIRPNIDRLKISKRHKEIGFTVKFAQSERISDRYEDIELEWRFVNQEMKSESKSVNPDNNILYFENEKRFFELRFDKKYKDRVIDVYLPFVMDAANSIRDEKKVVRLHTLAFGSQYEQSIVWNSINLEHPSTFGTLAIEGRLKRSIMEDLDRFVRRKDFYRKVGKAWKRGYLLYGPPGTGKSSLIAAIANYLKFDIYDLELTNVRRDSDLRRLLLRTANRSILVIEDIDCTVALPDRNEKAADAYGYRHREEKFTLSGLLNFIDGLWSSCGDERIIIFTTNNKEKLDPALLRPGRMDMHIHMSYLTPDGFKLLASTYLNVDHEHHRPILSEIEGMVENMNVTPAEVAEEFMKSDDVDTSLRGLLEYLCEKKKEMKKNKGVENDEGDKEEE